MTELPNKPFAWILGARQTVYENPWFYIDTIDARDPSGQPANYGLMCFKNLAVGILPYENGHVWLVGQSRVSTRSYSWEVPAGGAPYDAAQKADGLATAHRELAEETGLRAARMTKILEMELSNSVTDEQAEVYLATGLSSGQTELESSEDITTLRVSLDDALAAVETGQIRHALGVAALLKLDNMRLTGALDALDGHGV